MLHITILLRYHQIIRIAEAYILPPVLTLDIGTTNGHNFASIPDKAVSGGGTLRIGSSNYFPSADFGDFIGPNGGTVEYYTVNANIAVPLTSMSGMALTTYKHLKLTHSGAYTITMPNQDVTVYGDLTIDGSGTGSARLNTTATRTVTVNGNLNVNSGVFEFRTPLQTLNVLGNTTIAASGTFRVQNVAGVTHTLNLYGDLTADGIFDMSNGTNYANTYFKGINNASISGSSTTIEFYKFYVDKGTNTTPVLRLTTPISVTSTGQLVYLLNGTFRVDNSALTLILSDATTDFDVPSTACLSVNAGVVRVAYNTGGGAGSADLKLTGKLEVLGGTMLIGNTADARDNDIEYAAGGVPIIDVQGGQLTVSGQIRRSISITTGALNYLQSGGVTTIYGNNLAASRAKLEVLNPGSVFNMSGGGTISLINAGGTTFGDLYLVPESYSITGGTIQIGENTSTIGQTFNLFASCPLYNISLGTSSVNQRLNLNVYPCNVLNDLTINGNSEFLANGLNVNVKGNFLNTNSNSSPGINVGGFQARYINPGNNF